MSDLLASLNELTPEEQKIALMRELVMKVRVIEEKTRLIESHLFHIKHKP